MSNPFQDIFQFFSIYGSIYILFLLPFSIDFLLIWGKPLFSLAQILFDLFIKKSFFSSVLFCYILFYLFIKNIKETLFW